MIQATIGLGARLAVSGGRESAVRLILTTVGVALGTAFLLLAASADPAIRAQQQRTAWQHTGEDPADLGVEDAIHRARGAEIGLLLEQRGVDFGGRLIDEPLAVQHV